MATMHNENESSAELSSEDGDWEWLYLDEAPTTDELPGTTGRRQSERHRKRHVTETIIGARLGSFDCYRGDCVILRAEGSAQAWVAIVDKFVENEDGEKAANFVWFSNEKEIRNKIKKRTDFLPNEIYISLSSDTNPLASISGKATVVSLPQFLEQFPSGKMPRQCPYAGKLFVCRRGLDMRTTTYTEEFIWEDVYHGLDDLVRLMDLVREGTRTRRGRRSTKPPSQEQHDAFQFSDDSDAEESGSRGRRHQPLTPRGAKRPASSMSSQKRSTQRRALEFTPLGTRKLKLVASETEFSPFRMARNQLHVASVPSSLPCREHEFDEVYFHLEKAITNGTSNCIYISGTPGTGKTATVREVIARLEGAVSADELDDFIFVEINGMKITDPHHSYVLLWEALKGDRVSAAQALDLLEREFRNPSPRRVPCVVLMDELDQLVTKNQSVMYNFFNWPALRHSRLIVLAVANTMDLPERTLSNKISSRLGLTRISFPGYNHEQLMRIIQSRLEGVPGNIVEPDAVQFASRKVAAVSGDARRALDICRRAVELVETDHEAAAATPSKSLPGNQTRGTAARVTISTIKRAINEATSSPIQQCLRTLPFVPKLFLAALLARLRRSGLGESSFADVIEEMTLILKLGGGRIDSDMFQSLSHFASGYHSDEQPNKGRPTARPALAGEVAMELEGAGILILEEHKAERPTKVRLAIADDEISMAFRDDPEMQALRIAF